MANHLVVVILDSCRFDSLVAAKPPHVARLGPVQRRFSYASWTSPSHTALLMGLLPHDSPTGVFASEVYKKEYRRWTDRLALELSFKAFVPEFSLAKVLRGRGYRTTAKVSLPVLNPFAGFNRFFDDYRLMPHHNAFADMVNALEFPADTPQFYFLNLGETHYPYGLAGDDLPRISGVHGVLRELDGPAPLVSAEFFPAEEMRRLQQQQIHQVGQVDALLGALFARCPSNTWIIVTADHGELFGEGGYFGHGPIFHEKVFEVPFIEGLVPR